MKSSNYEHSLETALPWLHKLYKTRVFISFLFQFYLMSEMRSAYWYRSIILKILL